MTALSPASTSDLAQVSVMVVDDDKDMLRLLRTMFQRIGINQVSLHPDPMEALQTPALKAPDVLICDWEMARMDGGQFVEQFQRTPAFRPGTAIFFLTGRPLSDRVETAKRLKVQGFLAKPVSPKMLQARIERFVADKRARANAASEGSPALEAPQSAPQAQNEDDVVEI